LYFFPVNLSRAKKAARITFNLLREPIILALMSLISRYLNNLLSTLPALIPLPGGAGLRKIFVAL
jgi:hypothetical protein